MFRRSEKSILVKKTRFCLSERILKIFFKIPKIRILKLVASQLLGISQSSHRSYLHVKSHFWCFLGSQNSCYFMCPKNTKNAILQASMICVMKLRFSKKLTCNKFEVSDFFNFEKILKIRWKTQKRVILLIFFLTKAFT